MKKIESIIEFLRNKKLTIATAESCTAGLQASLLADCQGCGAVFESGFVVYSPRAKRRNLGVKAGTITQFGLTSEAVAREMAMGALNHCAADFALANTGKAESDDALNGVVCFAYAMRINGAIVADSETQHFTGARNEVRKLAAEHGLLRIPHYYRLFIAIPAAGAQGHANCLQ